MARRRFDAGFCVVTLSALALAGCGVESGKDQQETNRGTHVTRGDGDTPRPQPSPLPRPRPPLQPAPQPTPTITGSPQPEPPVYQPDQACMMLNPGDALDFGSVTFGDAVELDVVVINMCAHEVTLMSARMTSLSSTAFTLAEPDAAPAVLFPGGKRSITVRFEPGNESRAEATLVLSTTSAVTPDGELKLAIYGAGAR
jgi:hypothetical protein